jgi:hypothetical protein
MITIGAIAANALGSLLAEDFRRFFGSSHREIAERLDGIAGIALECLRLVLVGRATERHVINTARRPLSRRVS